MLMTMQAFDLEAAAELFNQSDVVMLLWKF